MNAQELWEERAKIAGAVVTACADWDAVAAYIAQLQPEQSDRVDLISGEKSAQWTVGVPGMPQNFKDNLKNLLSPGALLIETSLRSCVGGMDVGVAFACAAVADTGSCLIDATDEDQRLATMLPDISILILSAQDLLPDLASADALIREQLDGNLPRQLTFITGPSRTADIERVLTLGVHGPLELHVLLV